MLSIYLDRKPAVLKADTQFKLTRENPLFTDSGDYTFEVSLPLKGCAENLAIFSALHAPQVRKGAWMGKRLRALIEALPLRIEGWAVVTAVSDEEVKVQILGGRSALNVFLLDEQGRDRYIDELPHLGNAFEAAFRRVFGERKAQTYEATRDAMMRGKFTQLRDPADKTSLYIGDDDATALPIYCTTDRRMVNELVDVMVNTKAVDSGMSGRNSVFGDKSLGLLAPPKRAAPSVENLVFEDSYIFAPQPYLVPLMERVFRTLGFEVRPEDNQLRGTWFERLIIANVRPTLDYRQMLPHWTAREFIAEVQRFFGVLVEVDGRRLKITRRKSLYDGAKHEVQLSQVLDAYTTTLEQQGERKDTAGARVAYKLSGVPSALALPDDILAKATLRPFDGLAQLPSVDDLNSSYGTGSLYHNTRTGFRHTYLLEHGTDNRWTLDVVDPLGAYDSDRDTALARAEPSEAETTASEKPSVTVRIVPAFAVEASKRACTFSLVDLSLEPFYATNAYGFPATTDTPTASESERFSVYHALYPKQERKEAAKRDTLEVAYYSGRIVEHTEKRGDVSDPRGQGTSTGYALPMACGCPFYLSQERTRLLRDSSYRLLLNFRGLTPSEEPASHTEGMHRDVLTAYQPADTRVLMTVSFVHRGALSPTDRYIIHGRPYLCQKLEYALTPEGVSPLIKGYFYEMPH